MFQELEPLDDHESVAFLLGLARKVNIYEKE